MADEQLPAEPAAEQPAAEPKPLVAINAIVDALMPLKTTERVRVLRTVAAFLDLRL